MGRIVAAPVLAALVFMFFSCQKTENPPIQRGQGSDVRESPAEAGTPSRSAGTEAYVLRVNGGFYSLETDTGAETDRTKWADTMALGEKVLVVKERRATFAGDGKPYDFAELLRDTGKTGLAFVSQIAEGAKLAVVIDEKANLFKSPKTIDVTGSILSRKTVAGYFPGTEQDGFVEIKAWDPAAKVYRQNYIRLSSLSRKDSDIQSSILLQTALELKNEGSEKVRRDALLEAALLDYPDSVFSAEIEALVNPNAAAVIRTESAESPFMTVNDDNVNVRDLPDPVAGKVLGRLDRGTDVTVGEQTAAPSTVDGQSARWYRITEPVEGWVFGAYLE